MPAEADGASTPDQGGSQAAAPASCMAMLSWAGWGHLQAGVTWGAEAAPFVRPCGVASASPRADVRGAQGIPPPLGAGDVALRPREASETHASPCVTRERALGKEASKWGVSSQVNASVLTIGGRVCSHLVEAIRLGGEVFKVRHPLLLRAHKDVLRVKGEEGGVRGEWGEWGDSRPDRRHCRCPPLWAGLGFPLTPR
jgi:hypothetical protein